MKPFRLWRRQLKQTLDNLGAGILHSDTVRMGKQHANKCLLALLCNPPSLKLFSVAGIPQTSLRVGSYVLKLGWGRRPAVGIDTESSPLGSQARLARLALQKNVGLADGHAFSAGTTGMIDHNKASSSDDRNLPLDSNRRIRINLG